MADAPIPNGAPGASPEPAKTPAAQAAGTSKWMIFVSLAFIAGESAVQLGVHLPFADLVPEWASGLLGVLLMAGGAYFRTKLTQVMVANGEKPSA
jgi:hypothetical protein